METEQPRLTLRQSDAGFFHDYILLSKEISEEDGKLLDETKFRILQNLRTMEDYFSDKDQNWIARFANYVLTKVYIVFVTTESFDSAYRLFSVLNDRGLPLSNSDLIKNSFFSNLVNEADKDQLEEKWVHLEDVVGIKGLDRFLGYHLITLTRSKSRKSISDEYKQLVSKSDQTAIEFVDQLLRSAENFRKIINIDFKDDPISYRSLTALLRTSFDEWIPALLAFLNSPPADCPLADYLKLMEKITMQNWVRRIGRTKRLTVYYKLMTAIANNEGREKIEEIVKEQSNNEEFMSLLSGDVYGGAFVKPILLRLEEAEQDVSVTKVFGGRITIEHVLPQALRDPYWQSNFSEEEHHRWLHKLGNLTPLAGNKNSAAQYYSFDRKKDIYNRRAEKVSFDLTRQVVDTPEWNPTVVELRHLQLVENAKGIWCV